MIKILDFSNDVYMNSEERLELEYTAMKKAKKFKLDYFSNLEYHNGYNYFNLALIRKDLTLKFQVLLSEKELYFQYNESDYSKASPFVQRLIQYLSNQHDHTNKFYTVLAMQEYLYMIYDSMVQ